MAVARRAARVVARLRAAARAHDASTARVAARSLALRRAGWREDDAAILGLLDPALDLEGAAAWAVPRRDLYDAQDAVNAGADLGPLDDKERFGAEALAAGLPVAPRALVLGPGGDAAEWARALREHAPAEFVVKPAGGMSGAGIVFAARAGDAVDVHGRGPATWPDLAAWLGSRAGRLVVERRVRPYPAVAALTGQSGLATLRIITLGGPGREPEIVYAVARLPAGGSLVDNFRLAGGGVTGNLLAGVGRDGRLRRPFRVRPSGFGLERVDDHPDSGVAINVPAPAAGGLSRPKAVAAFADGFYVADSGNNRIIRVTTAGLATVVAGTGSAGFAGDGGQATQAMLRNPRDVEAAPDGGFLIADSDNYRVRRVTPDGVIRTVAGTGSPGSTGPAGDGGAAADASLAQIHGVNIAPGGDVYLSGSGLQETWGSASYRVRVISGVFPAPAPDPDPVPDPDLAPAPGPGAGAGTVAPPEAGATPVVVTPPPPTLPAPAPPVAIPTGAPTAPRVVMLPGDRARVATRLVTLRWSRVAGATRYAVSIRALTGARRGTTFRIATASTRVRLDSRRLGGRGTYRWTLTARGAAPRLIGTRRFSVRPRT